MLTTGKKSIDLKKCDDVDEIKNQPTSKEAKGTSDKLLKKSDSLEWEEISIDVYKYLLKHEFDNIREFKTALIETKGKRIVQNIAYTKWGTGGVHDIGANLFCQLLMELMDGENSKACISQP